MRVIKNYLKRSIPLQQIISKLRIYREYFFDAKDYCKFNLEAAERIGNFRYRIMLLVHNLEKGMCMLNPRPFGHKKVMELMTILKKVCNDSMQQFEYQLGVSILKSWQAYFLEHGWIEEPILRQVQSFVEHIPNGTVSAGYQRLVIEPSQADKARDCEGYSVTVRKSVRDFDPRQIEESDLFFAVQAFIDTPTACNRQMCKLYQIKNHATKLMLNKKVPGIHGFNMDTMSYFVITYDISAFSQYFERNQGHLNAGLAAMSFVNGLHSRGIGSCFLQWGTSREDDIALRHAVQLPDSERIAVIVGAGYYKVETMVPNSYRRPISKIYKIIQ